MLTEREFSSTRISVKLWWYDRMQITHKKEIITNTAQWIINPNFHPSMSSSEDINQNLVMLGCWKVIGSSRLSTPKKGGCEDVCVTTDTLTLNDNCYMWLLTMLLTVCHHGGVQTNLTQLNSTWDDKRVTLNSEEELNYVTSFSGITRCDCTWYQVRNSSKR